VNGGNAAALIAEIFSHPDLKGGLDIAGKTTVIYFFLVAGLRLLGKRELGQMNIYDLVLIIVLANAVQNAMVGDDNSLIGGIIAAITLLLWNKLFNVLMGRSKRVERLMVGGPILIVNHGHMLIDRMQRQGVTKDQVMAALREHGIDNIDKVRLGVLEVDGTISVVPSDSATFRTRRHFKQLRMP
jgi:uncharacterized membrane protein YcaP (DUF421 family)